MIQKNELRIGNIVLDAYGEESVVHELHHGQAILSTAPNGMQYAVLSGIPLTKEWLVKLGFEKANERQFQKKQIVVYKNNLVENKNWWRFIYLYNGDLIPFDLISARHVHQLQNLYFALTGKELAVNNETDISSSADTQ